MSDVTRILFKIESGDPSAAEQLLPLVYDELRRLAQAKLAQEKPGQTLQATALVHEAYVRLVDVEEPQDWDSRGHFFAAAAEAMRRILVELARKKKSLRGGGRYVRNDLIDYLATHDGTHDEYLDLDVALEKLDGVDSRAANIVKLRAFAGLNIEQAAMVAGVSERTAKRDWQYARSWLRREMMR
ncbi:ECF-type sigma factor [Stieleria sp. ICT_E10.1]|uniref:ECF-type sigma factor n=1 Tax=Stieleria sedimenti TaxID=2976331 RepID=UPI002180063F|nr:ECF-type sigma factor [Stieleria sedimenti]MCS7466055.1 ECF-type sigma factor [Stieleria sedimenti]